MKFVTEPYGCVYHIDNSAYLQSSENILQSIDGDMAK